MRLTYLTRVDIGSKAAQARQIQSMARAFYSQLGEKFLLVSSGSLPQGSKVSHRGYLFSTIPRLRYLGICLHAVRRTLVKKDDVVFTRDILVTAVVILFGGRAVYEAHKEPKSYFTHHLMRVLAQLDRFRLVTISGALGDYYHEHYAIPETRCLVAHSGVFVEDYSELRSRSKHELRAELGFPTDKKIIVHTGSLYKGGAELFGVLVEDRNDVLFIHVGGSPEECSKWATHYKGLGIHSIRFIPHQPIEQVRKFQVAADLLFYVTTRTNPIYWCTSPLKIFEYMASGNPIIGSRIGSVEEILNDANSYNFYPNSKDSIKEALDAYLISCNDSNEKARYALSEASNKYSWHIRARSLILFAQ